MLPQKRDAVAVLPPQLDDVQPGLGLERIVGVDADLDEVVEDPPDVAAAVVDDRQAVGVALVHDGLDARA